MLKKEILARFKNPGKLERDLMNYLKESNAQINQDKTIASNVFYHAKEVNGFNNIVYFDGEYDVNSTNVEGSGFIRPASEHFLIYGIRLLVGSDPVTLQSEYDAGNGLSRDLIQSTIQCETNGVKMLKAIPCTDFLTNDVSEEIRGIKYLDEPILWKGEESFKITLTNSAGSFGDIESVRFELIGIALIS